MTINRVLYSPTVSVIMCTFNRAHLISESIQSCLNQTLKSWELIIIDDYSTDETGRVVGSFKDPRISFIESPHHVGRSTARNMGLRISKGEYISFLDSDDLIDSKKLATDVSLLQSNKDASAVYSSAESRDISSGITLGKYDAVKSGDLYDDIAFYLPLIIATSQVTITRNLYETIGGFDPELDRFEDTDFFRRISRASNWIANPEQMVVLKNHADNVLSNQNQRTIIEMIDRYVSKTEKEIESCIISTKASPVALYLHYAQAIFTQKNGVIASLYLYLELLKRKPFSFALILISILKMTKHRTSTVIKKATRSYKNESTLPLGDVK